jgi:hypothetical protein
MQARMTSGFREIRHLKECDWVRKARISTG